VQGAGAVGGLGEVVERPEQQRDVGARVGKRQLARVALHGGRERRPRLGDGGGPSLLDVQRDRVDEVDLVAVGGQRQRVGARAAADVEHRGGRRGQEARQQLAGAQELQAAPVPEPALLVAAVVVGGDLALVGHGPEPKPWLNGGRDRS
jgi:hypothetical protein